MLSFLPFQQQTYLVKFLIFVSILLFSLFHLDIVVIMTQVIWSLVECCLIGTHITSSYFCMATNINITSFKFHIFKLFDHGLFFSVSLKFINILTSPGDFSAILQQTMSLAPEMINTLMQSTLNTNAVSMNNRKSSILQCLSSRLWGITQQRLKSFTKFQF